MGKITDRINLADIIAISYCTRCHNYELTHPDNIVFHGINSMHVPRDLRLKPREPDPNFYLRYLEYLKKPKIHLGPYLICGPNNPKYDLHFGFDNNELIRRNPEIIFMDHDLWNELAFFDEVEDQETKEKRLFLPKYKPGCEVLVESLDLSLARVVLYYSENIPANVGGINCNTYNAKEVRRIINRFEEQD